MGRWLQPNVLLFPKIRVAHGLNPPGVSGGSGPWEGMGWSHAGMAWGVSR